MGMEQWVLKEIADRQRCLVEAKLTRLQLDSLIVRIVL